MKKIMAIILCVMMAVSLFACGGQGEGTPTDPSSTTPGQTKGSEPNSTQSPAQSFTGNTGNHELDQVGFFDPNYDYTQNKRYKVVYMTNTTGETYDQINEALAGWFERMNCEYMGMWSSNGDNDLYLNTLQTYASEVDGFILDSGAALQGRIAELMDELDKPWMTYLGAARDLEDPDQPLLHPYVGFDQHDVGIKLTTKLMEYKDELYPDIPLEDFGFITLDYSIVPELHWIAEGAYDTYIAMGGSDDNYFTADLSIKSFDADTAKELVNAVFAANPHIEYWLIANEFDDCHSGVQTAIENYGYEDTTVVVCYAAAALRIQWEAGIQNNAFAGYFCAQVIYAEPIAGALYAFMNGDATPENIWPSWVNVNDCGGEGKTYASRMLPSLWLTYDTYQHYFKWSDIYADTNYYPDYPADGITRDDFTAQVDIPAYYSVKS